MKLYVFIIVMITEEFHCESGKILLSKGLSINHVSTFEGGGGRKMLTDAYVGKGGIPAMLRLTFRNQNNYLRIEIYV